MTDARKDAVLALTEQILREADDEFKGMAIHKVGDMYDSVDIFKGVGKINVRIAEIALLQSSRTLQGRYLVKNMARVSR